MKKLFTVLIIITLSLSKSFAQTYAPKNYYLVDSLDLDAIGAEDKKLIKESLKLFHKAKDDTSKVNALNDICANMMHEDWEKYQRLQLSIIEKAIATKPPTQIRKTLKTALAGALNNIGYIHYNQGDIPLALAYYHKSLKIKEEIKDKQGMATSYNNIGLIHNKQGDIPLGLAYYHKSLKIQEQIKDKKGMALSYNNIGFIHMNQGDIPLALAYYHKSLKIKEEIKDKQGMAISYNNIGAIHNNQGAIPLALAYYHKSLKIQEEIKDKKGMALSYNNIGVIHHKQGAIPLALAYYHKSLKIREQLKNKEGMVYSYIDIAHIALEQGEVGGPKGALALATKSLSISKEIGFPVSIREASKLLSKIYEKQGNGMKALEMHKLYITMRDSILSEEATKAAVQTQAKYEYEKEKEISEISHRKELEKQSELAKEEKEKQQIIIYAIASGLLLIIVFSFLIYRRLQITKKQKTIIEEQKEEVETQRDQIEKQKQLVEEQRDDIVASITYAKRIQTAILPTANALIESFSKHFVLYKPKDVVAGDFYWLEITEDSAYLAAADCTGHGVPGAIVSVVCHNALNRAIREYNKTTPAEILDKTRELVLETFQKSEQQVKDGMDISLMRLNLKTNELEWAGANNPLYILRDGEIEIIKGDKEPIGFVENPTLFTNHQIAIKKGDQIYLFTDGYADQFGGDKGKKMGYNTFREKLIEISDKEMSSQKDRLENFFKEWTSAEEQIDDVCVIGIKI